MATLPENDRLTGPLLALAGQVAFDADFPLIDAPGDPAGTCVVLLRDRAGARTTHVLGDFTVSGIAPNGFVLNLVVPALADDIYWIVGRQRQARLRAHPAGGTIRTPTLEDDAREAAARSQEAVRDLGRMVAVPYGEDGLVLADAAARAGKVMVFGPDGAPVWSRSLAGLDEALAAVGADRVIAAAASALAVLAQQTVQQQYQDMLDIQGVGDNAAAIAARAAKAANLSDLVNRDAAFGNLHFVQAGIGAVTRTAKDKARDVVDARDYGVKADGATDDTVALKRALDSNPGKTVRLPPGTMRLGEVGGLEFAGTRILGDSRYETIIRPIAGMPAGKAFFSNLNSGIGSCAFIEISNIRFRFDGKDIVGIDLSSVNNSLVADCCFAGTDAGAAQIGVGVRFGSPLNEAAYTNHVRDCHIYSMAKGVEFLADANSNTISGGEIIYCAVGVDAAPAGYLDTPRVIGTRIEGCGIGIKEKSEGANYIGCRFESNSVADIDFINNGGDRSVRPMVLGGYTAVSPVSLRNPSNAASPVILAPDMGRYDIEATTQEKWFGGRHVFAGVGTALPLMGADRPNLPYSVYVQDTLLVRNAIPLEWLNAAKTNSVISLTVDASNRTAVRSFNRATGTDGDVQIGAGPAVTPLTTATTALGSAALAWNGGHLYGTINRSATVIDAIGANSPEGVVAAGIGSTYRRTNGGAGTSFYVKESGAGNTGWVAK